MIASTSPNSQLFKIYDCGEHLTVEMADVLLEIVQCRSKTNFRFFVSQRIRFVRLSTSGAKQLNFSAGYLRGKHKKPVNSSGVIRRYKIYGWGIFGGTKKSEE